MPDRGQHDWKRPGCGGSEGVVDKKRTCGLDDGSTAVDAK